MIEPSDIALRDWFAGMALQKLAGEIGWHTLREHSSELAETCYHMADAMIERRNHLDRAGAPVVEGLP